MHHNTADPIRSQPLDKNLVIGAHLFERDLHGGALDHRFGVKLVLQTAGLQHFGQFQFHLRTDGKIKHTGAQDLSRRPRTFNAVADTDAGVEVVIQDFTVNREKHQRQGGPRVCTVDRDFATGRAVRVLADHTPMQHVAGNRIPVGEDQLNFRVFYIGRVDVVTAGALNDRSFQHRHTLTHLSLQLH